MSENQSLAWRRKFIGSGGDETDTPHRADDEDVPLVDWPPVSSVAGHFPNLPRTPPPTGTAIPKRSLGPATPRVKT